MIATVTGLPAQNDDRLARIRQLLFGWSRGSPEAMPIKYPEGWWGTEIRIPVLTRDLKAGCCFRVRVSAFLDEIRDSMATSSSRSRLLAWCVMVV